ncbi:MAG: pirin family protein [Planctomycetales bacterium]|nr:pirin family protein [Planctomycetales bacterium]
MLAVRKANERGHADHGWLSTYHTFSFAGYHDLKHMGFRSLRVINEDRISASRGFGTHGHRDMEIVSYVLDGILEHRDSLGNGEQLRPGEFQRITAGKGIQHSEFNGSSQQATHFYQIWLLPESKGLEPSYQQQAFAPGDRLNRWQLVASRDSAEGSMLIHQDVNIYLVDLQRDIDIDFALKSHRHAWIQILRGAASLNGMPITAGDGVAVSQETMLQLKATADSEFMLFDLA